MSAAPPGGELTFDWPQRRSVSFLLPGCIVLAAGVHALAFYLFQVVYPPTASPSVASVQVGLLTRETVHDPAFFRWLAAEDPAAIAQPREVSPPDLLEMRYRPSYAGTRALPQAPPDDARPVRFPPGKSALEIVQSRALPAPANRESIPAPSTVLRFTGALRDRANRSSPGALRASSVANLRPATFLIGVSDRGEVRYVFLHESSGDLAVDRAAETQLAQWEFAPGSASIEWDFVTFHWGGDVFTKAAAPVPSR